MKRFWHTCLAMIASATVTAGVADAQNNWNAPSEIGSYQSILSRAGYGQESTMATALPNGGGSGTTNLPTGEMSGGMPFNGSSNRNAAPLGGSSSRSVPPVGSSTRSMSTNNLPVDGGQWNGGSNGPIGQPMDMNYTTQPRTSQQMTQQMGQPISQPMGQQMGSPGCSTCAGGGQSFNGGGQVLNGGGQVFNGPAPMMGNGFVDTGYGDTSMGNAYSGVVGNAVGNGNGGCGGPGPDPGYHMPVYGQPFQLGQASGQNLNLGQTVGQMFNRGRRGKGANWVAGVYAITFDRDYEDNRVLSRNPSGDTLSTRDTDEGNVGGYGVNLTRRSANGRGLELRYWALNPGATAQLNGFAVNSLLPTLDQLTHVPTGRNLDEVYSAATNHVLVRNTDINNFEANLLNNGGCYTTRRGRQGNFELLAGFRYFQFDESLSYISNNPAITAVSPTQTTYQSSVENDLVGFQLGARNQVRLTNRMSVFAGVSSGIFNNRVRTRQRFFDQAGSVPVLASGTSAGREFDYSDRKDDVAILSELDLGVTYMVSQRLRARFGYRTLGVAGVALAADQIPYDFTDTDRIQRANSNGSLLLQGGYAGLEACF